MKLSLGGKIVTMVILVAVILSGTCIFVSSKVIQDLIDKEYTITSNSMAATVAAVVDGDKMKVITDKVMEIYNNSDLKLDNTQADNPMFEKYYSQYLHLMKEKEYIEIRDQLRAIQDVSEVDCVYTLCVSPEDKTAVYIVDGAYDDEIVTPGCFDLVEPSCYKYLATPEVGFPAFISDTNEYGWMVTSCVPIYDSSGEIVCFASVDIGMNDVRSNFRHFLIILSAMLLVITLVICIAAILYANYKIVSPINMLSEAAGQYGQQIDGNRQDFSNLTINTGDELEILLKSMVKMEKDIDKYIENLTHTREQLSSARQQANDMHELANMDSLTGIRNRLAYDGEIIKIDNDIKNGDTSVGIAMIDLNFLKLINDTYGHEQGNYAIIGLSRIVCRIFAHSHVFRIGGDEFVVILRNHDYENIEALVEEFNSQLKTLADNPSLQPWEKISAAFGYALFDPKTDKCADDVFKRADYNMYEHKKAMKATRK